MVPKEVLPDLVPEFAAQLDALIDDYALLHSHYWLSGLVAWELERRHGRPWVHTMHTMARVKNAALGQDQTGEPDRRELGEAAIVANADGLIANTSDEAA